MGVTLVSHCHVGCLCCMPCLFTCTCHPWHYACTTPASWTAVAFNVAFKSILEHLGGKWFYTSAAEWFFSQPLPDSVESCSSSTLRGAFHKVHLSAVALCRTVVTLAECDSWPRVSVVSIVYGNFISDATFYRTLWVVVSVLWPLALSYLLM